MSRVRMDKWLWAARFFKTRSLAARACELGRIEVSQLAAKPAREVHVGDLLQIKNDSGDFQVEVLVLSEMRGPAPVAQTFFVDDEIATPLTADAIDFITNPAVADNSAVERVLAPKLTPLREGLATYLGMNVEGESSASQTEEG